MRAVQVLHIYKSDPVGDSEYHLHSPVSSETPASLRIVAGVCRLPLRHIFDVVISGKRSSRM